jgi:uncharacterized membrane protein YkoI
MKKAIITILSVLSIIFIFAGCGSRAVDDVTSKVESTVDSAKDKIESGVNGSENSNQYNSNNSNAKMSKDEIKKIALRHANVKEDDVYDFEADLETDDGVLNYEVSFETKSTEYHYHIHADTGEILSSAKEEKN